ncbi:MAG: AMP-dependent synthetase, partial [Burkholderiales bacterium]|nr:AMP-dependent synthetase [Burkholderiales bacterium]
MNATASTVRELLGVGAPEAAALSALEGPALTYSALRGLVSDTLTTFNARGIGRNDRIAIVLDN